MQVEENSNFEHIKKYFEKLVLVIIESRIPDEKPNTCENFNLITNNKSSIIQAYETNWADLKFFQLEKNDKLLISIVLSEKAQDATRTLEYWELSYELDEENITVMEDTNFINLIRQIYLKSRLMPGYKYAMEHKKQPRESTIEYTITLGSHANPSSLIKDEIPHSFSVKAAGGTFEVDVLYLKTLPNFTRAIPLNDFLIAESYHGLAANKQNNPLQVDPNPPALNKFDINQSEALIFDDDEEDEDDISPVDIAESLRNFSAALLSPPSLNLFETTIATYTKQDIANFRQFYDKLCAN